MKNKDEIKWELMDKKTNALLKQVEKLILKQYGRRCKIIAPYCPVCRAWIALDNLKVNF